VLELPLVTHVLSLHLLQEDQVAVELVEARAQVVDPRHPAQSEEIPQHALVDVVGGYSQGRQAVLLRCFEKIGCCCGLSRDAQRAAPRAGKERIASALLQEKQRPAASSQGSQAKARCSRGASATGTASGTCSPKTCSVFCVTPSG